MNDEPRYIILTKTQMNWVLIKFLKESLDFLADDPRAKGMNRGEYIRKWIDENLEEKQMSEVVNE